MENRWKAQYQKEKNIVVDYASTGSTVGVTRMIDGDYAIGFIHAPLSEAQKETAKAKRGEVLQIPVALCAVVPVYNLKELKGKAPLRFTGEVLADIFLGKIVKWNDPALKQLNEGLDLPDAEIAVVHREDSSGTTSLFTDYLQGASAAWRKEMGGAESRVQWPVGIGASRNSGVAAEVQQTEGSLGYVDLIQALNNDIPYGAIENKDKTAFIHAEPQNMTAAAQTLANDVPQDLTFSLSNRPGKDSYPISGAIWAVCYRQQPEADAKKVVDFLHWATHEGQRFAKSLAYAPLPDALVERIDQRLKLIRSAN
jgi:phosphate transport system substrate-binding protein